MCSEIWIPTLFLSELNWSSFIEELDLFSNQITSSKLSLDPEKKVPPLKIISESFLYQIHYIIEFY